MGDLIDRQGSDLISRQAAIELMLAAIDDDWEPDYAKDRMCELPSAQSERKQGEWLDNETSYSDDVPQTCTCSVCRLRSCRPVGDFCKWCGADMRGEQDG